MKMKNKFLILAFISLMGISSYAIAQSYVFRSHLSGVKAPSDSAPANSGNPSGENGENEEELGVSCFAPENVGKIGTESSCSDMLIVDRNMLTEVSSSHYLVGGNESFAIPHPDSGRIFTFDNNEHNVFTGQVSDMTALFYGTSFNGNINYWDTSNVIYMRDMFRGTTSFNKNISSWNTSNVKEMYNMFYETYAFNQDIGGWDTSNVRHMHSMFWKALSFNQDISGWDTSDLTTIGSMFAGASSFNQNLSDWCVSNINSSQIGYFDTNATSWTMPNSRPVWGTCPQ